MFWNLLADTYSPNILLSEEKVVSVIHLCPYFLFFFHFRKSFICNLTSLFLRLLFLDKTIAFFLIFIPGVILFYLPDIENSYSYHGLHRLKQILSLSYSI